VTVAIVTGQPDPKSQSQAPPKGSMASALMLPAMLAFAWAFALSGSSAPGAVAHESTATADLRWILYFAGFVFVFSSVMHSVFRKKVAASIGWATNGFELEIAAVSLGLGAGCFYAVYNHIEAMTTISFPIVSFLFLAGLNHLFEIVKKKNYAPNNTVILIWDFGIPVSLVALLISIGKF
jgi:hypothetical protein